MVVHMGMVTQGIVLKKLRVPDVWYKPYQNHYIQHLCTSRPEKTCWEGSSREFMLKKLEIAIKGHQVDEAWKSYNNFKSIYGYPNQSLMSKLITEFSYSSDPNWLRRACSLILLTIRDKTGFIRPDLLSNLTLSLARAQMPALASKILRVMLEKENIPPLNIFELVILHMVKTEIGASLASNILAQIVECFGRLSVKHSTGAKIIKPNTMVFNLVLDACVRFGSSYKGQQLVEMMSQLQIIADAHTVIIIAQIHEMNGQRDELKKFKDHIVEAPVPLVRHYRQFYDSLLSLHFKFDDIDSVSGLIREMYNCHESRPIQGERREPQKPCFVPIGSDNLRTGLRLPILPDLLPKDPVLQVEGKQEFVMLKEGILVLTNKALSKLIIRYKRCRRIGELSKLLRSIQEELARVEENSLCSNVVDALIHLGWLETAHDILEDLESAGTPLGTSSYTSLLLAYHRRKMLREAEALLKQTRRAGLDITMPDELVVQNFHAGFDGKSTMNSVASVDKSDLAVSLIRELREEENMDSLVVNEFNSSIYFFMKAKMIEDALKTYRKMQEVKIKPTVSTFFNLVCGYSSMEMYRAITILWGDIKINIKKEKLVANRDLYEELLFNFLRGGYFGRVMEVIGHMEEHEMAIERQGLGKAIICSSYSRKQGLTSHRDNDNIFISLGGSGHRAQVESSSHLESAINESTPPAGAQLNSLSPPELAGNESSPLTEVGMIKLCDELEESVRCNGV
ncbi:hypothetical protein RJ640_018174 [Escallonia rubra]|uniref:At1g68980-like TPR repeats domain-containing protein n=1 Tax=Escallonia rubra TaxID=112253 RepID=A0AA88RTQ8_9ASTE|nr:hypothetical protein RJ640_018174 [Escallonia rubra]